MNVRNLIGSKPRRAAHGGWRETAPPEERIVTLGWLCMTGTLLAALLVAAYLAI